MSARDGSLAKTARRGIAAVLVILLAAVGYHLLVRRSRAARPKPAEAVPEARKIDRKEGIRHREYKNGKVWADLRADSFFLGGDGLDHLEGAVEIVDYGRADGGETRISADRVAYDKDMVHFTISGHVRVRGGDLAFESDSLDYDKNVGLYRTDRGGSFASDRMSGSGRTFEYSESRNEIRLSGGFRLEIKTAPDSPATAVLSGDSLVYARDGKRGGVEGRARVVTEDGEGTSNLLRFELTPDEHYLQTVTFEKEAKCVFSVGRDGAGSRGVEAETVRVLLAAGSSRVAGVEAEGSCRLTLAAPPEPGGRVRSGKARLAFGRDGTLEGWTASAGVTLSLEQEPGQTYELGGESVSYSGQTGVTTVVGKQGAGSRLETAEFTIEAPSVSLSAGSKTIEASGGVSCLLKPRPDGAPIGFFSGEAPVFVTCRAVKTSGEDRRFHCEGEVRVWQDDRSIQAGEMDILERTGEVRGRGGVTAGFPEARKEASGERRVEAGGDEMSYSPAGRVVLFRGRSLVKIPGARLTAATVAVGLLEGKKEIQELRASGGVVFLYASYEGRGEEARYDPEAETLVLTGGPVLAEKGKGASRGDKLTFRLGDGRILIENKGQGRSITVVKS